MPSSSVRTARQPPKFVIRKARSACPGRKRAAPRQADHLGPGQPLRGFRDDNGFNGCGRYAQDGGGCRGVRRAAAARWRRPGGPCRRASARRGTGAGRRRAGSAGPRGRPTQLGQTPEESRLHAVDAEGAFEGADPRVRAVGRQIAIAALAIGAQFEHGPSSQVRVLIVALNPSSIRASRASRARGLVRRSRECGRRFDSRDQRG